MPNPQNLPRCEFTDIRRIVCGHCRDAGVDFTLEELAWIAEQPRSHHLIPQYRPRTIGQYPTGQTWAGVETPDDRPAGIITCDGDGHAHPDAFICTVCVRELKRHLTDIPALVKDLHIAVAKDVRFPERGAAFGGDRQEEAPVNFNIAARAAVNQLREALVWADPRDRYLSWQRPVEFLSTAALWMEKYLPEMLRRPDIAAVAEKISRAVVHGRTVIDRPRDVIFYGVCPSCTGDIWQERVDPHDRDARIVCPRGCGYTEPYLQHEQTALDAGEDRWLTLDELVGAIHSAGEIVSRKQILRWVEREGLPREERARPQLVGGEIQTVAVDVYRLGDVRQLAADAETDRKSLTTSQVANLLGVSEAAVRKMVERGTLTPNRPGAKPLRFTREALGNSRSNFTETA